MDDARDLVDRYYELLNAADVEQLSRLYTDDAEIVRYDGIASTGTEIADYYRTYLAQHAGLKLRQIDQFRQAFEVLLWDALVDSDAGILETVEVMLLDEEGKIRRHIPGFRGFWGR